MRKLGRISRAVTLRCFSLSRTLQKAGQLMSVATKVEIQINAKLGGEIWSVPIPVRDPSWMTGELDHLSSSSSSFSRKHCWLVGIDTYRDSQNRSVQMVGFVASINSACTRYYSRVIEQRTHHDLTSDLKQSTQSIRLRLLWRWPHHSAALQKSHQRNGIWPAKVIVYDDGVNDFSVVGWVIDSELPALNDMRSKVPEGYE